MKLAELTATLPPPLSLSLDVCVSVYVSLWTGKEQAINGMDLSVAIANTDPYSYCAGAACMADRQTDTNAFTQTRLFQHKHRRYSK